MCIHCLALRQKGLKNGGSAPDIGDARELCPRHYMRRNLLLQSQIDAERKRCRLAIGPFNEHHLHRCAINISHRGKQVEVKQLQHSLIAEQIRRSKKRPDNARNIRDGHSDSRQRHLRILLLPFPCHGHRRVRLPVVRDIRIGIGIVANIPSRYGQLDRANKDTSILLSIQAINKSITQPSLDCITPLHSVAAFHGTTSRNMIPFMRYNW